MKKSIFYVAITALFIACGGVKNTQKAINSGNYSNAINRSIENLVDNKTKKSNQPYVILLEEAFKKNEERELQRINYLQKDGNAANLEAIYNCYRKLKGIQNRIQPLLPLEIYDEGRPAEFHFKNYDDKIIATKENLSKHLYDNAIGLINTASHKIDYRKAYDDLIYLQKINPDYADSKAKIEEAHAKGIDYVKVGMKNNTDQIIPVKLEEELLNFNTYGINDLWTEYHNNPLPNITYDYKMDVALKQIDISPEQVNEKQIIKEKQIKDGEQFVLDKNGNVVKDSLGNKIKIDKFKTVRCNFYQFTQFKSAQVTGVVTYTDLKTKQQLDNYPLTSEFVFEHIYANYNGDKRALESNLISLLQRAAVPFPTNEQMVYDAGEDLKGRLKSIITKQQFN